jgi:hypothetical protein
VKKIDFEGAEKLFCKKLKKFSKTPLKNVKKYNIMVAIIGFVLKNDRFGERENVKRPIKFLTIQGGFIL